MKFTNVSRCAAGWTVGYERDGRELLVVVVKATYRLPRNNEEASPDAEQQPLVQADEFTGEPGLSAPINETDYAHHKPGCDVLLVGAAHAPTGKSVTSVTVGLKVASMVKQFDVVGHRVWQKGVFGIRASNPEPFEVVPITYDCAFGGTDRTEEKAKGRTRAYLSNPVGCGYWHHTDNIDGQPLPNTQQIGKSVESHSGEYAPMAFSPIGRNWLPRSSYAGTYDKRWFDNQAPFWPDDFDYRHFQAAPPDQLIGYPQGGEQVVLHNLTADGKRSFCLPRRVMPVTFIPYRGRDVTREAVIDTIVIEPEFDRFTMTWRIGLPLGKSVFDVKETVVGDMSLAWHRARRFPGKAYYPNLAEAMRARRGGALT